METNIFKERTSTRLGKGSAITKEGVLKGVHIIGLVGKANCAPGQTVPYKYKESAIQTAVEKKLYDDVNSFIGHSDENGNRPVADRIGFVVAGSVVHKEGAGALGDIQFNIKHPHYEAMKWWADNHPEKIMLSQESKLVYSKSENAIVEIKAVESVDFVVDGNTTESLFKEGVLSDKMTADAEERKLDYLLDTFQQFVNTIRYPLYYSTTSTEKKVLTQAEKALKLKPYAQDLVKELNLLASATNKEEVKEPDMDIKSLTLADLAKDRPDLVNALGQEAVAKEAALNAKVLDAVKDVAADKRSEVFMKQVKEAVVKNDVDMVTALVADRTSLLTKETVVAKVIKPETNEEILAREAAAKTGQALTDDEILAKVK